VELAVEGSGALVWRDAALNGGHGLEDGFAHAGDAKRAVVAANEIVRLVDESTGAVLAWMVASVDSEWWMASAPGAPGAGEQRFLILRSHSPRGRVRSVWDWSNTVRTISVDGDRTQLIDAEGMITDYEWRDDGAHVAQQRLDGTRTTTLLAGFRDAGATPMEDVAAALVEPQTLPLSRELGEPDYRMSEHAWSDAGRPRAHVVIDADETELEIRVDVRKSPLHFRASDAADPGLDNEHPDIHSDGVQLHLWCEGWRSPVAWLAIPDRGFTHTRVHRTAGSDDDAPALTVNTRQIIGGYEMHIVIARAELCPVLAIDVLVNDMAADRQRRRGQLVLSGARGDRIYLRGDRQPLEHFIRVRLPE
jgi:hypothetical protein